MIGLELLEEKIRTAANLIRSLRQEKESLERRLQEQASLSNQPQEDLSLEIEALRRERREILARVDRMLAILDEAAVRSGDEGLLAAVDEME
jgi:FtsZ-binding cell division protein ZapB